jgi:hypothetical protein
VFLAQSKYLLSWFSLLCPDLQYGWHFGPYDPDTVKKCNQPALAGGQCFGGYGGYVWDSTYFPDPTRLLSWVHEQGLEIILNIHDQCGIDVCQPNYLEAANRTGIDPASSTAVPCRFLDKAYAAAMSELV